MRPIRNKHCLWQPCLLMNRDDMSDVNRGSSKDAPYQVLIHLVKRFQRRRVLKIGQSETRIAYGVMFVDGSEQNEQSLERTFHICFLPSFTSFDWAVSEEKIKMWKVNGRQKKDNRRWMTYAKWWQKLILPLARWTKYECILKQLIKQFIVLYMYMYKQWFSSIFIHVYICTVEPVQSATWVFRHLVTSDKNLWFQK